MWGFRQVCSASAGVTQDSGERGIIEHHHAAEQRGDAVFRIIER